MMTKTKAPPLNEKKYESATGMPANELKLMVDEGFTKNILNS